MKRLLVGYDGSEDARAAVYLAAQLGRRTGAAVTVLSAEQASPKFTTALAPPATGPATEAAALELAEAGAALLRRHGVHAAARGVNGAPADALLDASRRERYDLLIVGRGGRGDLVQLMLGSVAKRVAAAAPCPVLVVRGPAPQDIHHVLVGVTQSAPSHRAADAAIAVALACGARLSLVHVIDSRLLASTTRAEAMLHLYVTEEAEGRAALAWLSQRCQQSGVESDTLQVTGQAAETLLHLARERDVQVIAIGRPARPGLERLVFGSESDAILRGASAAVLITGERAALSRVDELAKGGSYATSAV